MTVPTVSDTRGVLAAISEFRDLVNIPRLQQGLMKDLSQWGKLCSAMDVIEDTGMAIRSYSSGEETRDKGRLYLETYGVLQALVVQQDAVSDLCAVLGSSRAKGDFPELTNVRTARVSVAGHPTKRQRDGDGPYHLVQMSLGRNSFELVSLSSGSPKFKHVSVRDLIRDQEAALGKILTGVIDDLRDADAKHKAKFHGSKLQAVFPQTLSYSFEKINEHVRGDTLAPVGSWGIEQVRNTLNDLRRGLEAREIHVGTYDSIDNLYDLIEYPLEQLKAYLNGKESEISGPRAAKIFSFFIEKHVGELRTIATEIDDEFSS